MKWKGQCDSPKSQYETFDVKHIWSFIQVFHTEKELQVINYFPDISRADNS